MSHFYDVFICEISSKNLIFYGFFLNTLYVLLLQLNTQYNRFIWNAALVFVTREKCQCNNFAIFFICESSSRILILYILIANTSYVLLLELKTRYNKFVLNSALIFVSLFSHVKTIISFFLLLFQ